MKHKNFLVLINPISGTAGKANVKDIVEKRLSKENISFRITHSEASGDYSFLPALIENEKITHLIICGGDGTVSRIASSLKNIKVSIGIIPMGSGNGLAFAAGIPKNPEKALEIILTEEAIQVDGFSINGQFSCMLCGLGFDAQVAHDFASQNTRGLSTYIQQTIRNFFVALPYPFVIKVNGSEIKTEAFFISIANSNQFGNHFTIAPQASLSDGLLDIVIVNKTGKLNLIYNVLKQVRAGKLSPVTGNKKTVHYFQCREMQISNHSNAPLHIDGEPVSTFEEINIKIIEKAFWLICKK